MTLSRVVLSMVMACSIHAADTTPALAVASGTSIVKEVVNVPGIPQTYVLDESKTYKVQGKSGGLFYSPGTYGLQIEPKHLGQIYNVMVVDFADGHQELVLSFRDGDRNRKHVISFDKDGNMTIKVANASISQEKQSPASTGPAK